MAWSAAQTASFVIAIIVYVWLMILAYFAHKHAEKLVDSKSPESKYTCATYFVGTAAAAALLLTIAYS
jgi:hypothetical protein